jgi:hypothetical protein
MLYYVTDLLPMCSTLLTLKVRLGLRLRHRLRISVRVRDRVSTT